MTNSVASFVYPTDAESFVISNACYSQPLEWSDDFMDMHRKKFGVECERFPNPLARTNNYRFLELLFALGNRSVPDGHFVQIMVVPKEMQDGIEFLPFSSAAAYFSVNRYIVEKLKRVVHEGVPSSYVSTLSAAAKKCVPSVFTLEA